MENGGSKKGTLSVRDNRTGREYELEIMDGDVIRAMDLRQIKVDDGDFGMMAYDPGFTNTANTRSTITYVDGGKGILRYRGYPIEQLAEKSTFLEVAYLILKGELPDESQLEDFSLRVKYHSYIHENLTKLIDAFRYNAHAMGITISTVAAMSTFYPESKDVLDAENRWNQITRLVAKMPTIAAFAYRHHRGLPLNYPENELTYSQNFLSMLYRIGVTDYTPNPVLERALEVLFILHADHEQNCFYDRHACDRELAGRSVLGDRGGDGGALRPPPRRRERSRSAHAERDRQRRQHSRLHGQRQKGRAALDGLRTPGVQGVRSPGEYHQGDGARSL